MKRYKKLFHLLKLKKEGAFVPFVILGDPDFETSIQIIETLISSGADALELGIPFSDPVADGPIIQKSILRAFSSGINVCNCFKILKYIRKNNVKIPIGLLLYANLIFNKKIDDFYSQCADMDIDSILIADLPIEESEIFFNSAIKHNIDPVFICPPNADDSLLKNLVYYSRGYIYLLSRSGVTGITDFIYNSSNHLIHQLKKYSNIPILQGFGFSKPNQVSKAMKSGINGIICGSAIIQIIEKYFNNKRLMLSNIKNFILKMKKATKNFSTSLI